VEGSHVEIAGTAVRIQQAADAACTRDPHDAVRRVFTRTADALYRFILLRVRGRRDVADDLLQQTCLEAAKHRRPPTSPDECEAWLRGIARNLVRRHWRRMKREAGRLPLEDVERTRQWADDLEARPLPPDAMIRDESISQLLLAVTSLSAADQNLVFAYYFDGRPQAAIASDLGATEKSIESRLFRLRGRLRAVLRKMERSGER
jgi:RNA polymerase sigma-70 factor (ECF subfamily)